MIAALVCGFFWEMWNYYSYPKWIYHIPGVGVLHIFEMPLLGYLGYLPFAWELYALRHLLWRKAPPLRLYIRRLSVLSGSTVFEDHTRAPAFAAEFKPIAFELLDFSTRAGSGNDYTLSAVSEAGERLNWSGTLELSPLASRGRFELSDVKARTVWPSGSVSSATSPARAWNEISS